jgi:hypothetical protein
MRRYDDKNAKHNGDLRVFKLCKYEKRSPNRRLDIQRQTNHNGGLSTMRRQILTATLAIFALVSYSYAESCQMERLNARADAYLYDDFQLYEDDDACEKLKGRRCEEGENEKARLNYIKTFRTAPAHFARVCEALKKDMNNSKLQEKFFLYFPSNFYMFNSFFGVIGTDWHGYTAKVVYAPLIDTLDGDDNCIELFFKLNTIQKECIYEKMINIVQDASLRDEGGIPMFMNYSYDMILADLNRFISVLSKRSEKEQRDFWYLQFNLYDAPSKLSDNLEKIKTINKRSYDIMVSELKKAQANDVH